MTEAEYVEKIRALAPAIEALHVVDDALSELPESARLWTLRGDLLRLVEPDHELPLSEVERSYRRAIKIDPRYADAYFELGTFFDVVMANPRKARQYLHKAWLLRRAKPNQSFKPTPSARLN